MNEHAIRAAMRVCAASGKRRDVCDETLAGLRLRLTPAGTASWVLGCRDAHGRARRFPLGRWPHMGIAEARQAARIEWAKVRAGADPIAERKRKRAEVATLRHLIDAHRTNIKSWPEAQRRIKHVFAALIDRPLSSIRPTDLQRAAHDHAAVQSASAAVRYLRPVLKRAAQRGDADAALASIVPPASVRRRDRVLNADELRAVLAALGRSHRPHALAMRFMLLTMARREEVGEARWGDIDGALWTIPRNKSGHEHRVPLSRQALAMLLPRGEPGELVFGKLGNWDRNTKLVHGDSGVTGWQRHDLRRTAATMLGDLGVQPHVIEAALGHAVLHSSLASIYNRARYDREVAHALQDLADCYDTLLEVD